MSDVETVRVPLLQSFSKKHGNLTHEQVVCFAREHGFHYELRGQHVVVFGDVKTAENLPLVSRAAIANPNVPLEPKYEAQTGSRQPLPPLQSYAPNPG